MHLCECRGRINSLLQLTYVQLAILFHLHSLQEGFYQLTAIDITSLLSVFVTIYLVWLSWEEQIFMSRKVKQLLVRIKNKNA
jgi:hypothetical protein